jgi:cell division septal protein FtsQ
VRKDNPSDAGNFSNESSQKLKPQRPPSPLSPSEVGRRAVHVHAGRKFAFVAKGGDRTKQRSHVQYAPGEKIVPQNEQIHRRHLEKVRPGVNRRKNIRLRNLRILIGGFVYSLISPSFNISHVQIEGMSPDETASAQALVRGQSAGKNIILFSISSHKEIESRVADSNPEIAHVALRVTFPSTLRCIVTERHPSILLSYGPDAVLGAWIVDPMGLPIRNPGSLRWNDRPADLMKVYIDQRRANPDELASVLLGKPLPNGMKQTVQDLITLKDNLMDSILWQNLASVRIDNADFGLNMRNHLLIKLGDLTSLDKKIAIASALVSQRANLVDMDRYIDVSDPDWPAVMPKSQSVAPATTPQPDVIKKQIPFLPSLNNQGTIN